MGDRALIVNDPSLHSPHNTMRPQGATMTASYNTMNQSPNSTMSSSYRAMTMDRGQGNFSSMEQQTFHSESKSEFSSMSSSGGGTSIHSESLSRYPQNATADIQQLDANQNYKSKTGSLDTQLLRRIKSESADTRSRQNVQSTTTTQQQIINERSGSTVNGGTTTVVIPQTMMVAESATAEMKGGGTTTISSRRTGTEQKVTTLTEGGQCTCCPYGYHIDLGFVQYCENMTDGSYLKKLKRVQREKRKLRKSMEVFINQQEEAKSTQEYYTQPETVQVKATAFLKNVEHQNNVTNKYLDEIDSTANYTMNAIDNMMYTTKTSRMYSESDETSGSSSPGTNVKFNTFPIRRGKDVQEEISMYNSSFERSGRTDSQSSLSSISSERSIPYGPQGYTHTSTSVTSETISKITHITSDQLAATMATHLPSEEGAASPQSSTTIINKNSLTAIREAMAVSLQRLKELEEQVKAIPVLKVRISVLKEEKRLLALQQKARDRNLNTKTIGVGDFDVNEVKSPAVRTQFDFNVKSPPVPPKPKVRLVGVGDHSVLEAYLLQPDLPPSYTTRDNEYYQRDTLILERDRSQSAVYSPFGKSKPQTRTVGIGEGNVFDESSMKIHEKELRTVIIGQNQGVGRRNVGVDCRVATRDVGMLFSSDEEKPSTRTVGINVDTGAFINTLNFKAEEMKSALKEVLSKNVRSIGTSCAIHIEKKNTGVQYSNSFTRSIGVSDDHVDIIIKHPVPMKSIGVDVCPLTINKSVNTDFGWRLDQSTNTMQVFTENKASITERQRLGDVSTMTDDTRMVSDKTQTDLKVFYAMDQIKNQGSNPRKQNFKNTAMNTEVRELIDSDFDLRVTYKSRGLNAYDVATNTEMARRHDISVNTDRKKLRDVAVSEDTVDSFVCSFDDEVQERMEEETVEEVVYREQEEIIDKGWSEKTRHRTVVEEGEDDATQSSSSVKTIMVTDIPTSTQVVRQIVTPTGKLIITDADKKGNTDEEMVEKKITSRGGSYTLQTITRKSVSDDEEDDSTGGTNEYTTSSVTRKTLVDDSDFHSNVKNTHDRALRLKAQLDKLDGDTETKTSKTTIRKSGGLYQDSSSISGDGGSGGYKIMTSSISGGGGGGGAGGYEITKSTSISGGGGTGGYKIMKASQGFGSDDNLNESQSSYSSSSTTYKSGGSLRGSGDSSNEGGYKIMTASSKVRGSGISGSDENLGTSLTSSQTSESSSDQGLGTSSSSDEVTTITQIYTLEDYYGGGKSYYEKYVKSGDGGVKVVERRPTIESKPGDSNSLKSCIKTTKSEKKAKKGIRFAENVVGGYTSSSTESDDDDDGSDTGSTASYDEGSYDGREGSIVYQCKDDEAIAKGIPGAKMFDQNIRETFELSRAMRKACETLSKYLEDSTEVQTKELNASLEVIKEEWFKISSNKLSEPYQVEDFMSSFNEISRRLLEYIVNVQDSNGNTALHYAVSHCNFEIVSLLLDTGVIDLDKQNKAGYTSSMLATLAYTQTDRQREVVQRLFTMSDINARASKDGQTALMLAVSQGRLEMVNQLIEGGADVNIQDSEGSTALMCACEHGHPEIVKILLAHPDCDSTLSDNEGSTALSIAMDAGHKDIGVILYAHVNFKSQISSAIVKKRKSSSNTSPLPSPTIR